MLESLLALALTCSAAPGDVFVAKYRASYGTLYHAEGCPDMKGIIRQISRADAARRELTRCPTCLKDDDGGGVDQPSTAKIEELLKISGIQHQLEQIPAGLEALKSAPAQDGKELPPQIVNALIEAFKGPELVASAVKALRKNARGAQIDAALPVLSGQLAAKFTAMEKEAAGPKAEEEAKAFIAELANKPVSPLRRAAAEQIADVYGMADLQVDLQIAFALAVPRAKAKKERSNKELAAQNAAVAGELRTSLRPKAMELVTGFLLFAYRSAPDAEVLKYAELLNSSADLKALNEAVRVSLKAVVEDACDRAGAAILDVLPAIEAAAAAAAAAASPAPDGSPEPEPTPSAAP